MKNGPQICGGIGLVLCLCWASYSSADTIRLKSGTQLTGSILTETETELQIEVQLAGGTIFKTETVKKEDVAEFARATPAERAETQLQDAYRGLAKYRLDPKNSQPVANYDNVINNVLQKFLRDYPGSRFEPEVKAQLAEWEAERGKVASGVAKMNGEWLPAEQAAQRSEELRVRTLLDKARDLIVHRQFPAAIDQYRAALKATSQPELADEVRRSCAENSKAWIEVIERQREQITVEIKMTEDRLALLKERQQSIAATSGGSGTGALGEDAQAARRRIDLASATEKVRSTQDSILNLRQQVTGLDSQIASAKLLSGTIGSPAPPRVATQMVTKVKSPGRH